MRVSMLRFCTPIWTSSRPTSSSGANSASKLLSKSARRREVSARVLRRTTRKGSTGMGPKPGCVSEVQRSDRFFNDGDMYQERKVFVCTHGLPHQVAKGGEQRRIGQETAKMRLAVARDDIVGGKNRTSVVVGQIADESGVLPEARPILRADKFREGLRGRINKFSDHCRRELM